MKPYKSIFKESESTILDKIFDQFPDDAKDWSQATDELRDISRTAREYIGEYDNKEVKALNFKSFNKPSEWNTESKKYILKQYGDMSAECKKAFEKYLKDHFEF